MKLQLLNSISFAIILCASTATAQNPLDKPARNVRDENLAPAKTSGYQNPLESPAYNRSRSSSEKAMGKKANLAPPTAGMIAREESNRVSRQNAALRARQQTLQAEAKYLRSREEALSKAYATSVPSMTNNQLYNYNRERAAIRDQIVAKEQELKQLQRIEAERSR